MRKTPKYLIPLVILVPLLIIAVCILLGNANKTDSTLSNNIDETSIDWSSYTSNNIELTSSIKITKGGVYTLTGTIEDGLIEIETEKDVKLILNGVTIKNSNGPAIYAKNVDNLIIELAAGTTNTLTDSTTYTDWDEDVCATLFSHDDLVLQGEGTLVIAGNYEDGIVGKDDLKIVSGNYVLDTKDDAIRGRDSVYITGGTFDITSGGDAIKANNSEDVSKGYILIDGGSFEISAGDDGIHAETNVEINGGAINIKKSYEGIEGSKITINGGDISVVSSDDGFNAAGGNDGSSPNMNRYQASSSNYGLVFNGGTVYVNAQGDGLDSNGYLEINGGTITVDGPTSGGNGSLDAEGTVAYNGGTIVAVGSSGMAVAPTASASARYSLSVFFTQTYPARTKLTVKDSSGNILLEHTSTKTFQHAILSSESFQEGETYTIYINDEEYIAVTLAGKTTQSGSGGMVMPGGQQGGGMMRGGR